MSTNGSSRGDGVDEEGKERGEGKGGGIERSYMEKGVAGGGWSTYKYEHPPVNLSDSTESERNGTFRPISVEGDVRQNMEQGVGQGMGRGWRHTENDVEDMGENAANASHSTTTTSSNVQNFASNAIKSISTSLFSTSTSRPIQTYAIHQKVNISDGDERSFNRRGRDREEESGALSSQIADKETVTF